MRNFVCFSLIVVILTIFAGPANGASIKKKGARQATEAVTQPAAQPGVVTLVNQSTPSVISNTPELVPAVIDPNPTTVAPLNATSTTPKPEDGDDDDSSEEEEEDADAESDADDQEDQDQDQDDDNDVDDGQDEQVDESGPGAKQIYLPGYLTNHGELLVPLDAVQRAGDNRVQYEVIEDPTYPAYAQFANAQDESSGQGGSTPEVSVANSSPGVVVGSSAGGIGGGSVETVLDILQQSGPPPASPQGSSVESEPSEEEDKAPSVVDVEEGNIQSQRHLWIGGSNPTDFGFHF